MTYELPRTESGHYDFSDIEFIGGMVIVNASSKTKRTPYRLETLASMIDTNAREEERERCARLAAARKDWATCDAIRKLEDKP